MKLESWGKQDQGRRLLIKEALEDSWKNIQNKIPRPDKHRK